jgi:hypothetical protein
MDPTDNLLSTELERPAAQWSAALDEICAAHAATSGALRWRAEVEHWINSLALNCPGRVAGNRSGVVIAEAANSLRNCLPASAPAPAPASVPVVRDIDIVIKNGSRERERERADDP